MIPERELRERLKASADTSYTPASSTLMERLPQLAAASAVVRPPIPMRIGRRVAATIGSIGLVGWLAMGGAGAMAGIAAKGDLPAPVQQFVADVVIHVGIDLPDPEQEKQQSVPQPSSDPSATTTTEPPSGTSSGSKSGAKSSTPTTVPGTVTTTVPTRSSNDDSSSNGSSGSGSGTDRSSGKGSSGSSTTVTTEDPNANWNDWGGETVDDGGSNSRDRSRTDSTTTTTTPVAPPPTTTPVTPPTTVPSGGDTRDDTDHEWDDEHTGASGDSGFGGWGVES